MHTPLPPLRDVHAMREYLDSTPGSRKKSIRKFSVSKHTVQIGIIVAFCIAGATSATMFTASVLPFSGNNSASASSSSASSASSAVRVSVLQSDSSSSVPAEPSWFGEKYSELQKRLNERRAVRQQAQRVAAQMSSAAMRYSAQPGTHAAPSNPAFSVPTFEQSRANFLYDLSYIGGVAAEGRIVMFQNGKPVWSDFPSFLERSGGIGRKPFEEGVATPNSGTEPSTGRRYGGGGGGGGGGTSTSTTIIQQTTGLSQSETDALYVSLGGDSMTGDLDVLTDVTVHGTLSGATLFVTDLKDCNTIDTDSAGNLICGTDEGGMGSSYYAGRGLTLNGSTLVFELGSSISGSLLEFQTVSGAVVHAQALLRSSGALIVRGNSLLQGNATTRGILSGASLVVSGNTTFVNTKSCALLTTDVNGLVSCGSATSYTAGQGLTLDGTSFRLNSTISGSLVRFTTVSGSSLYAKTSLASSGTLVTEGNVHFDGGATSYFDYNVVTDSILLHTFAGAVALGDVSGGGNSQLVIDPDAKLMKFSGGGNQEFRFDPETADAFSRISFYDDGSEEAYVLYNGDVGSLDLGVTGNEFIRLLGNTITLGNGGASVEIPGTASGYLVHAQDQLRSSGSLIVRGNATFDINTLFVNSTTNRVGIGTTLPETELEVVGTMSGRILHAQDTLSSSGSLVWEGAGSGASLWVSKFAGAGLTDCNDDGETLGWNASSQKFECGDDDSGAAALSIGRGLTLDGSLLTLSSSISGSLLNFTTVSGSTVFARNQLRSSGSLIVTGASALQGSLTLASLPNCAALVTSSNGAVSCGSPAAGALFTSTGSLQTAFDQRYLASGTGALDNRYIRFAGQGLTKDGGVLQLSSSISGSLIRFTTVSGSTVFARNQLRSSGSLIVTGNSLFQGNSTTRGVMSGASLVVSNLVSCSSLQSGTNGALSCGSALIAAGQGLTNTSGLVTLSSTISGSLLKFTTVSGSTVFARNQLRSSGSLIVSGTSTLNGAATVRGVLSGASLVVSGNTTLVNSKNCSMIVTDSNGLVSCGSATSYTAGQGLTLDGTAFKVGSAISGSLLKFTTISGSTVFARNELRSSGSLLVSGNAIFDRKTLFVDSSNNRVGIGTTSPASLLTLSGASADLQLLDGGNGARLMRTKTSNGFTLYNSVRQSTSPVVGLSLASASSQFGYISSPSSSLRPANPSISAWFKLNSTGVGHVLVAEMPGGAADDGRGYTFTVTGGNKVAMQIGSAAGSYTSVTGSTSLTTGTWYHLAGTYDGSALKVYVNGVLDGTTSTSVTISYADSGNGPVPQTFYIGAYHDSTASGPTSNVSTFPNGVLDEVRVYNTALTLAQISAQYSAGIGTYGLPSESNLVGGWHLDENTGSTAYDYSGNGGTVTLVNSPSWTTGIVGAGGVQEEGILTSQDAVDAYTTGLTKFGNALDATWLQGNLLKMYTNSVERIRVSSGGLVGIGTSAPGSKLSLSGSMIINANGVLGSARADAGLALEIIGTASGRSLHAQDLLRSSGALIVRGNSLFQGNATVRGTMSGASLVVSNLVSCTSLQSASNGALSCATSAFSQTNADARYVRLSGSTMTGSLTIGGSGNLLFGRAAMSGSVTRTVTTVDTDNTYTSMAISADGYPVIATATTGPFLRVIKCKNLQCTSSTLTDVDTTALSGTYPSIAIGVDGLPIISYYDTANTALRVVKCGNQECSSGNTITTIDNSADMGQGSSIAIPPDGLPVISYFDGTGLDLEVAKCLNISCTSSVLTTVDSTGSVGYGPSMIIGTDGYPVIAYEGASTPTLKVAKCNDARCASSTITVADSTSSPGTMPAIAIAPDGKPIITYGTYGTTVRRILKCGNSACSSGNLTTTITGTQVSSYGSITIGRDGMPILAYQDSGNSDLLVYRCNNISCSSGSVFTVDANATGIHTSIVIAPDGLPIISNVDSNSDLEVVRCADVTCGLSSGNAYLGGKQIGAPRGNDRSYAAPAEAINVLTISNPTAFRNLSFLISGVERMAVTPRGILTVGEGSGTVLTSTNIPSQSVLVGSGALCVDNGGGNCDDSARKGGTIYANSTSITSVDLAENYPTKDLTLKPGELVMMDSENAVHVVRAHAGSGRLLGVVSTKPGLLLGGFAEEEFPDADVVPVALAGRVPILVSTESGAINIGDGLTLSSIPGVARKAAAGELHIAYALETYAGSGSAIGSVRGFIALDESHSGLVTVPTGTDPLSLEEEITEDPLQNVQEALQMFVASGSLVSPVSDEIERQLTELDLDSRFNALASRLQNLESRPASVANTETPDDLALSGSLTANLLAGKFLTLEENLSARNGRFVGDLYVDGAFHVEELYVPNGIRVDGELDAASLTAGTLHVTEEVVVDGTITLQKSLNIGSGATINFASGSILAVHDLLVQDALHVIGPVTIEGLATFFGNVDVRGVLTVSARQAGFAVIPATGTSVTIHFDPPFTVQPVVTASPDFPLLYAVSRATGTGFTIRLAAPAAESVTFSWTALTASGVVLPAAVTSSSSSSSGAAISFPVDGDGVPTSTSDAWNSCIRNHPMIDGDGQPVSCDRYHNGYVWEHPDLMITFTYNTTLTPALLQLPEGYEVEVADVAEVPEVTEVTEVDSSSSSSVESSESSSSETFESSVSSESSSSEESSASSESSSVEQSSSSSSVDETPEEEIFTPFTEDEPEDQSAVIPLSDEVGAEAAQ